MWANVPPVIPCWRHKCFHLGAIVAASVARCWCSDVMALSHYTHWKSTLTANPIHIPRHVIDAPFPFIANFPKFLGWELIGVQWNGDISFCHQNVINKLAMHCEHVASVSIQITQLASGGQRPSRACCSTWVTAVQSTPCAFTQRRTWWWQVLVTRLHTSGEHRSACRLTWKTLWVCTNNILEMVKDNV